MNINKDFIIDRLKAYLKSGWLDKAQRKNPEFANSIARITKDDLILGNEPMACFGQVDGNATAVGTQYENGGESTYTLSLNFSSDTYLFVDKKYSTLCSTVKMAQQYFPELRGVEVKYRYEAETVAEKAGKKFCRQYLNDLNYSLSEYRLNRYKLIEDEMFTIPMKTINAEIIVENKKKTVHIGNWYYKNGKEYVDIYISDIPATTKTKIIIAGIIAAVILIILLIIISL